VFKIVIPIEGEIIENRTLATDKKSSEKSSEKIIRLLRKTNDLSAKDLAKTIGLSERAIEKQIAKLKSKGMLKRIGPDKGGYWKVLDE
jgi:ATP-dependent DNA helicase RecG|tara:strand:- start:1279 stop:1542 length:264 start_codon:yes stop_codon:yes gene_type:complete